MAPRSDPKFEIVVTGVAAVAVAEGYYTPDEATLPLRLGAYALRREVKAALVRVAQAEADRRGLIVDPFTLPNARAPLERGLDEVVHLIRPEDVEKSNRTRTALATIKIRHVKEKPPSWET